MSRWRIMILAYLATLAALLVIDAVSDQLLVVMVAATLVVAPLVHVWVAILLVRQSRAAPEIASLALAARRTVTLVVVSVAGAIAGGLALARIVDPALNLSNLPEHPVTIALAYALILLLVPTIDTYLVWRRPGRE